MSDADLDYCEPSDAWLSSLVRHLRRLPPGVPVPAALLVSWRRQLRREAARVAAARRAGRDPYSARDAATRGARVTHDDLVLDLLRSPEGQVWVSLIQAMPALLRAARTPPPEVVAASWRRAADTRRAMAAEGAAVAGYLDSKLRGPPYVCRLAEPPHAVQRAACNAVTPSRARAWRAALAEPSRLADVLAEIRQVGADAAASVAPLRIWDAESGPPRGLWPDPPPPDADPAAAASGAAASAALVPPR